MIMDVYICVVTRLYTSDETSGKIKKTK